MMPSSSKKQHNFMAAIAHNPAFAKKVGIPQSVGKDFDEADKGKKFGSGGRTRPDVQKVNKSKTDHGKMTFFKEGGDTMASKMNPGFMAMMAKKKGAPAKKMAGGGMAMGKVKTAAPSKDGIATKGKTKGTMVKMSKGGKYC
jgi:predicted methyltransferase